MFKTVFSFILFSIVLATPSLSLGADDDVKIARSSIVVHNHILWNYRGCVITVMDVVKRLEQFGQNMKGFDSMDSAQKLEFYQQNWRGALQDIMDSDLIYQDAVDHNMQVSDAEGRDQLVHLYGEHYITEIDRLGLTMKEALDRVKKDLLIQRMLYFRVHFQARNSITPSLLAQTYKEMCKEQPETDFWTYQTVTFKGPTATAVDLAQKWQKELLTGQSLEACQEKYTSQHVSTVTSRLHQQSSLHLSAKYLETLTATQAQTWSDPVIFKEDAKEGIVRLFYLKEKNHQAPPAFSKVRRQIEDHLFEKAASEEQQRYIVKLRRQLEQEQGQSLQLVFNPTSPLFSLR